jgi:hypothetical protein
MSRVLLTAGHGLSAALLASLVRSGSQVVTLDQPAHIEQAKRIEGAYAQSGRRVRNGSFKARIAAMHLRKTAEWSQENAKRQYNAMRRGDK